MANPPPPYPNELTKAYWDKKKGVLAKMAGATGVGQAAQTAQDAYDKIVWKVFDDATQPPPPSARRDPQHFPKCEAAIKKELADHVMPTIKALQTLAATAKKAADDLTKKKLKDAATVATDINSKAGFFAVGLKDNGVYFSKVAKDLEQAKADNKKALDVIAQNAAKTTEFLKELLKGLTEVKNAPSQQVWD